MYTLQSKTRRPSTRGRCDGKGEMAVDRLHSKEDWQFHCWLRHAAKSILSRWLISGRPKSTWCKSVEEEYGCYRKSWGELKRILANRKWWRVGMVDALKTHKNNEVPGVDEILSSSVGMAKHCLAWRNYVGRLVQKCSLLYLWTRWPTILSSHTDQLYCENYRRTSLRCTCYKVLPKIIEK